MANIEYNENKVTYFDFLKGSSFKKSRIKHFGLLSLFSFSNFPTHLGSILS